MDELRRVPHSIDAEQSALGSMILDARCVNEAATTLRADDFYLPAHQDIFETLLSMYTQGKPIDAVTLKAEMRLRNVFDESSTNEYLARLLDVTPVTLHLTQYAAIIKSQALLRKLDEAASHISESARALDADAQEVLDSAEQYIFDIRRGKENQRMFPMSEVLHDVYLYLSELVEAGGRLPGITSGFQELDDKIGGLLNSAMILIAARPGVGKTSLALNMGINAVRSSNKAVAFFSLEMSRDQLVMRLLSSEASVSSDKMLRGNLNPKEFERIGEASGRLSEMPFYFDDNPAITVGEIKAKCRRIDNLGLIIVDYLQLMQSDRRKSSDNRTTEVGDISRSLKIMAKELGVPVLCCAQLSRANEKRTNHRPVLSDLRESGSMEQDADVVLFLHREDQPDTEMQTDSLSLIIAKNRHGATGDIELNWTGEFTRFTSFDRSRSYDRQDY